jgi:hypothetical protein
MYKAVKPPTRTVYVGYTSRLVKRNEVWGDRDPKCPTDTASGWVLEDMLPSADGST